jgi:hypothetical protein
MLKMKVIDRHERLSKLKKKKKKKSSFSPLLPSQNPIEFKSHKTGLPAEAENRQSPKSRS